MNWLIPAQWFISRLVGRVPSGPQIHRRRGREAAPKASQVERFEQRTLLSGGALDPSFGAGGLVMLITPGTRSANVADLAVQNDGKIVVVGAMSGLTTVGDDWRSSVALWRFNADGTLDSSFGSQGVVRTRITPGFDAFGWQIRLDPDGKMIVLATAYNSFFQGLPDWREGMFLLRYSQDGGLDPTFGDSGISAVHNVSVNNLSARGLELQGDGKILVAMTISPAFRAGVVTPPGDKVLLRFDSNGRHDRTFDTDGTLSVPQFPVPIGKAISEQSDEKLVMVRSVYRGIPGHRPGYDWVATRTFPDGSLDDSFGKNGVVIAHLGSVDDYAFEVRVQADGKILVAGTTRMWDGVLMRLNADGSLDTSFNGDGLLRHQFHSSSDHAYHIALQPNGRIVVAGYDGRVLLARYFAENPNLRIDVVEDVPATKLEEAGLGRYARGRLEGSSVASLIWDGWSSDWTVVPAGGPIGNMVVASRASTTIVDEDTDQPSPKLEFSDDLVDQAWSTGLLNLEE